MNEYVFSDKIDRDPDPHEVMKAHIINLLIRIKRVCMAMRMRKRA